MNIQEAKREIANTLRAYHRKDKAGRYLYPAVRQRPILLMGPPGIGKTAILEQVAHEEGVGLVSYTMTHHTRQSAVGLPRIEARTGPDGEPVHVTVYTLSEIIASVYDCMARTGKQEGILFIDEINCVSETLAPTMLQFLQNKTFGSHRVPAGWMIVAAGNPAAYNRSVREFDVVTLDRVRQIDVGPDLDAWMHYARQRQVHGAVLSYLSIRENQFYRVERTPGEVSFVTARGWEDLSELMKSYEALGIAVGEEQIGQFLRDQEIARGFAGYYRLYQKYAGAYDIPGILNGQDSAQQVKMAAEASMEERFAVVNLVLDCLDGQMTLYEREDRRAVRLHEALSQFRLFMKDKTDTGCLEEFCAGRRTALQVKLQAGLLTGQEQELEEWVLVRLENYGIFWKGAHIRAA
ncbi:MAG: AAA family ATPase, partial [Oscillospiraceae bacterium]|nr:AAA family ATPase [Oscillospiraceae bacterium]